MITIQNIRRDLRHPKNADVKIITVLFVLSFLLHTEDSFGALNVNTRHKHKSLYVVSEFLGALTVEVSGLALSGYYRNNDLNFPQLGVISLGSLAGVVAVGHLFNQKGAIWKAGLASAIGTGLFVWANLGGLSAGISGNEKETVKWEIIAHLLPPLCTVIGYNINPKENNTSINPINITIKKTTFPDGRTNFSYYTNLIKISF